MSLLHLSELPQRLHFDELRNAKFSSNELFRTNQVLPTEGELKNSIKEQFERFGRASLEFGAPIVPNLSLCKNEDRLDSSADLSMLRNPGQIDPD